MEDTEIWIGLLLLTAFLYLLKWLMNRNQRTTVYRISRESLERSKEVIMAVLPMVEDDGDFPLDQKRLPYPKENVKSAAKIMAYYFWRKDLHEELSRIKYLFVAISRFQDDSVDMETQERRAARERKQLTRELDYYMTHSPFNAVRSV